MMINEQNYVDKAENVIKQLKENSKQTNLFIQQLHNLQAHYSKQKQ